MRLLFDQTLSRRLVERLADVFPSADHVGMAGLERDTDEVVWEFARRNDLAIVTKDADFRDLCLVRGAPPKVIWLQVGNCTTEFVESTLRTYARTVSQFLADPDASILVLS
jgi:predicted nuclease of predicted toxin-antitoxin system